MNGFSKYVIGLLSFCLISLFSYSVVTAAIVTDGTVGQSGALTGPKYIIPESLGTKAGNNLFQSFSMFNINTSESATFTGASTIGNIIARVTGGSSSSIDGMLSCSISGANLYLMNPAGVMFGKNATLDLKGSFYVTTADYLKLSDGGRYDAKTPSNSTLTSAPPSAFGFLTGNPAGATVTGALLQVPTGKTISIAAGDITITNGYLYAPGGQINIASVASTGEALMSSSGINADGFSSLGKISITQTDSTRKTVNGITLGNLDVSNQSGGSGSIYIRGGKFVIDNGYIFADTYGDTDGGGINVNVTGDMSITNSGLIEAGTAGKGNAGSINIETNNLSLTSSGNISTASSSAAGSAGDITIKASDSITIDGSNTEIYSETDYGNGHAGSINIEGKNLSLTNSGEIFTATFDSPGTAGGISIKASDTIKIGSGSAMIYSATDYGTGNAGGINIETNNLTLSNTGSINTSSMYSSGAAGNIEIKASDTINIDGGSTAILSETLGQGNTGGISIETKNLSLTNSGKISTLVLTGSTGKAGGITIKASDTIDLDGNNTRIYSGTSGAGNAGNIYIQTNILNLTNSGQIGTSAQSATSTGTAGDVAIYSSDTINIDGESGIYSQTYGKGHAGDINIETKDLSLTNDGQITNSSLSGSTGNAGSITIKASDTIKIDGYYDNYYSGIYSRTYGKGNAGSIYIETKNLNLTNFGEIDTSAYSGSTGNAGDIAIKASDTIKLDTAGILSETFGAGSAGSINIETKDLSFTNFGYISTSSAGTGNAGSIKIKASDTIKVDGYYNYGVSIYYSAIDSGAYGAGSAGSITIETKNLSITNESQINTSSAGAGSAGDITIKASDSIKIDGESGIYSGTYGKGNAGSINIEATNLSLTNSGQISTSAASGSSGNAGNITIKASDTINIAGHYIIDNDVYTSEIASQTAGTGNAGNINIETKNLSLNDDAKINTSAVQGSAGNAGSITIKASDTVNISGYYAGSDGLYASEIVSQTYGKGDAGSINIDTKYLSITNIGGINTSAREGSTGNGGSITIKASDSINISGYYAVSEGVYSTGILSETSGKGNAGSINIETNNLSITNDGSISTSARLGSKGSGGNISIRASDTINISGYYDAGNNGIYHSGVSSETAGSGNAGDITVQSRNLYISDYGLVTAQSSGTGSAGNITVKASDLLQMNSGYIATSSKYTTGGNIDITANDIRLYNDSAITSNVSKGKDKGGNITISSGLLCVLDDSAISADADIGYGGDITINASTVFLWNLDRALHASSTISGQSGTITIHSPLTDISGSMVALTPRYLNADKLLPESCQARRKSKGSFVIRGLGNLPTHNSMFSF
ncbi:MAG: filamentous hemagglutinin N-terminal domain-containing protein [Nitrospirae bacterium]|nr:filamentous hemagglutinin N-terminal domain-containing protein [Nitrospirota bacterium]